MSTGLGIDVLVGCVIQEAKQRDYVDELVIQDLGTDTVYRVTTWGGYDGDGYLHIEAVEA